MVDENAFGILVSYFGIDDDEYADDDVARFVERWRGFIEVTTAFFVSLERPAASKLLQLGHASYLEFPEPADPPPVLRWVRELQGRLRERDYQPIVVLTHGGRWVAQEDAAEFELSRQEGLPIAGASFPSEPLRRALHAEAAAHAGLGPDGPWGAGVYADTEAIEALGLTPKNAPTRLQVGEAAFFRIGH